MRILNNLDFNYNQILNALQHTLAADPNPPREGQLWYNSTTRQLKYYNGVTTIVIADNFIPLSQKGAANGVASLDGTGKVLVAQLPDTVTGGLDYQGTWNAATNTPALTSGGSGRSKGDYYKVSVAGATVLDGISDWKVGDWVVFNGTTWDKLDQTESVSTVAGRAGAVILTVSDIAGAMAAANNLSEITNQAAARGNLGLGTGATRNVPVSGNAASNELVLGNDSRLAGQVQKISANVGDGTNVVYVITHNLNTQDIAVTLRETLSPFGEVIADIEHTTVNTLTIRFAVAPTTNQYRVVIVG
jgi:hypothetical protein